MWNKILRYFHTLKYLKGIQFQYRIYYLFRKNWRNWTGFSYDFELISFPEKVDLKLGVSIISYDSFFGEKTFKFLNNSHTFSEKIDWNFNEFGKLWTYNLNYFEYLSQNDLSKKQGLELINDFVHQVKNSKDGLEPFPTSLRIIYWIKFLVKHNIDDPKINKSLFTQLHILKDRLEYHLLGNHLLENGFALLFGAYYFQDQKTFRQAEKLILIELEEQTLPDGGHFELSPMYHQHIFYRTLDAINLVKNNSNIFQSELLVFLEAKATLMWSWLDKMTFGNGEIPLFNDSAFDIAPTSKELFKYAERLQLNIVSQPLKESGYRVFNFRESKIIVDVGKIGPDYIPGHAHSDMLSFIMYVDGHPLIVDTGTSTYENNSRRQQERSTSAHNTVQINEKNQSDVWGGFRVGKRAKIQKLEESKNYCSAAHSGFQHQRTFRILDDEFLIQDEVNFSKKNLAEGFLHFHSSIQPTIKNGIIETERVEIKVENHDSIQIEDYYLSSHFNKLISAKRIKIRFKKNLTYRFKFKFSQSEHANKN